MQDTRTTTTTIRRLLAAVVAAALGVTIVGAAGAAGAGGEATGPAGATATGATGTGTSGRPAAATTTTGYGATLGTAASFVAPGDSTEAGSIALPTWTVRGAGFGHAVGMSQYGAQAMGAAGYTAAQILGHYYTGSAYEARTDDQSITVNVERAVTSIAMSTQARTSGGGSFTITVTGGSAPGTMTGSAASAATFTRSGSEVAVACSGCSSSALTGAEVLVTYTSGSTFLKLGSGRFDVGSVRVLPTSGASTLEAVQSLRIHDQYLDRIREAIWSWTPAALQAQAAAARAYALRALSRDPASRACRCHLTDTIYDQVYGGYPPDSELPYWSRWTSAVRANVPAADAATKGMVPTYGGAVLEALYSSSSGGRTQSNEDVWGTAPVPYLRSVSDPWSLKAGNPWASWRQTVAGESLAAAFGLTDVARLDLSDRTVADAVDVAVATSAAGDVRTIDGEVLRQRLGLPSTFVRHLTRRLYGSTQYTTAAATARTVTSAAKYAVVASGESANLSDAIVAGPLAANLSGPLLLTEPTRLSSAAVTEIKRRRPTLTSVVVVGRTSAVSDTVVSQLKSLGVSVRRIAGTDRYDTAGRVAEEIRKRRLVPAVVIGNKPVDALPASGPASALREPVLWTVSGGLSSAARRALTATGAKDARVVGSSSAISTTVESQLHQAGLTTARLTGADRYRAAAAVALFYAPKLSTQSEVVIASAADTALVHSVAASNRRSLIVYVGDTLPTASAEVLQRRPTLEWVTAVGGSVVPTSVLLAAGRS